MSAARAADDGTVDMVAVARPSMTYLARMLFVLANSVDVNVTSLALMSRMNHKRCNVVIRWLEDSGYAQIKISRKKRRVALTHSGRTYAARLLEVNCMGCIPYQFST